MLEGSNDIKVFLSSDWDSIPAGSNWLQEIEAALHSHDHFVALIADVKDAGLPWVCYEVGYARGRGLRPKIFVFGGISPSEIPFPISGIQFVGTWDTNRWTAELSEMGVHDVPGKQPRFATLFRQ